MITMLFLLAKAVFTTNEKGELMAQAATPDTDPSPAAPELPPGDYGMMFVKMFLSLIALVALLGITVWFLRRLINQRMQKRGGGQLIHILERRAISPKTLLYLVQIDNQKVLLAESHLEVRRLHTMPDVTPLHEESPQ